MDEAGWKFKINANQDTEIWVIKEIKTPFVLKNGKITVNISVNSTQNIVLYTQISITCYSEIVSTRIKEFRHIFPRTNKLKNDDLCIEKQLM